MMQLPEDAALIAADKRLLRVFIGSPYTSPDPVANVERSIHVGSALAKTGWIYPVVPLLTHLWEVTSPHSYEFWIEYTKRMLMDSDVLFRMSGESSGADAEVRLAEELGMPVFYDVDALMAYAEGWINTTPEALEARTLQVARLKHQALWRLADRLREAFGDDCALPDEDGYCEVHGVIDCPVNSPVVFLPPQKAPSRKVDVASMAPARVAMTHPDGTTTDVIRVPLREEFVIRCAPDRHDFGSDFDLVECDRCGAENHYAPGVN